MQLSCHYAYALAAAGSNLHTVPRSSRLNILLVETTRERGAHPLLHTQMAVIELGRVKVPISWLYVALRLALRCSAS